MKIETKFNPGDKVWMMDFNKPVEKEIHSVLVGEITQKHRYQHTYTFTGYDGNGPKKYENELFKTKDDLIKSL